MPIEGKLIRCAEDDPKRCQSTATKFGQCPYKATEGNIFCQMHSGHNSSQIEKSKRAYQLQRWQQRVDDHADGDQAKSLRGEIGILRMTLETVITQCKDETQLLMYAPRISDLVTRIEKVVSSCHRLEEQTGMLLDREAALRIGMQIVEIVSRFVTDEGALSSIGDEIVSAILASMKKVDSL